MRGPTDFLDDPNQQRFYTLERLHGIPEFVKGASTEEQARAAQLPSHVFADVKRRKFPCHTKAATWLAQAYFTTCQGAYSKKEASLVQDRITKAAKFFNIAGQTDSFQKNWSKIEGRDKTEIKEADYGLIVTDPDTGEKMKLFPMPNPISVKMAGEYLYANRFQYPYAWRRTAARNILKRAYEYDKRWKNGEKVAGADQGSLRFDTDTREYLEKAAGFGAALPEHVSEQIAQRVIMIGDKHKPLRVKLAAVAKAVSDMPQSSCTPKYLQKLAAMLDEVDRQTGICGHYHHGVSLPEESLFQLLSKQAKAALDTHITLTTGNTYPVEAFRHMPIMSVDLKKAAEVLPTLPRDDAALLERVLSDAANEEADGEKRANLGNNPYSKLPGEDPFSKENMVQFFKNKGLKPRDLRYTLAVPVNE